MTVISGCVRCHQLIWSGGRPWCGLDGLAECPEGGPHQPPDLDSSQDEPVG